MNRYSSRYKTSLAFLSPMYARNTCVCVHRETCGCEADFGRPKFVFFLMLENLSEALFNALNIRRV